MANEVKFNIKLIVDGKEKIVDATTDVSKFAKEFENARTASTKLRDELLKFNQVGQSFQNMVQGLQAMAGVLQELADASAEQEVVERKLANNMRNTMDAREEDIQSIKDLCAAQQQLGVIGDEVQLAGAQELATYLEKKSSLERLIPVMNDMLAQQYGLNASSEEAAQIASMLGKVMDGQVGALSRYGYKFDEIQEQILKCGTEEQRAAVLAEVVESAVGGMNAELAKTDAGKAKQLANRLGDAKEMAGALYSQIQPLVVMLGQFGAASRSLSDLVSGFFGARTAILNFVSGTRLATVAGKAWQAVSVTMTAMTRTLTAAFTGASVGATTLTVAVRGLMISTGVGAAIVVLTLALQKLFGAADDAKDGLEDLNGAADRARAAQDALTSTYGQAVAEIEGEKKKLKELIDAKRDTRGAIQHLNEKYGESFGYYKTAQEWYDALIAKSEDYCMQLAYEAQAKALYQQKAENQIKLQQNFDDRKQLWDEGGAQKKVYYMNGAVEYRDTNALKNLRKTGAALIQEQKDIDKKLEIAQQERDKHLKAMGNVTIPAAPQPQPTGKSTGSGRSGGDSDVKYVAGSLGDIEQRMQQLRKERLKLVDTDDLRKADEMLLELELAKKRLEENSANLVVKTRLEGWEQTKKDLSKDGIQFDKGGGLQAADFKAEVDKKMLQDGMKDVFDHTKLNKYKLQLPKESLPSPTFGFEDKDFDFDGFKNAASAIDQLAGSMAGLAGESKGMAAAMAGVSMAAALAQLVAGMVQKANESITIWDWIAGVVAGTATVISTASQLKSIGVFAKGGIAYGPTLGLFGEYAGASTNPEVVAPLDKLRSMIGGQGAGGTVEFRMRGRDLVGVIRNETQIGGVSGKRSGIQ